MTITRAEMGEMIARMYDRLDEDELDPMDACLIVEVLPRDADERDEDETMGSEILMEASTERTTITRGMLDMAQDLYMSSFPEEDDD